MKITKLLDTDPKFLDNMYPRLFHKDQYYVTFTFKTRGMPITKFMKRDALSICSDNIQVFNTVEDAQKRVDQVLNDPEFPVDDIIEVSIKHVVRGFCRKCGRKERREGSLLCLPCSYT